MRKESKPLKLFGNRTRPKPTVQNQRTKSFNISGHEYVTRMTKDTTTQTRVTYGNSNLAYQFVSLISRCFEPSQPQWITSGLDTNFTLSPSYQFHKSSYHKSCFYLACFHSAGTQHGNLPSAGWPISFCRPTQEPCVSHSQHRRNRERFWNHPPPKKKKKTTTTTTAGEWIGRVEISKEEIPGSKRSTYGYILNYSRLERENV